jgi:hypothetical protein
MLTVAQDNQVNIKVSSGTSSPVDDYLLGAADRERSYRDMQQLAPVCDRCLAHAI